MRIFSADTLDFLFLVTDILLEQGIIPFFSGNLSTETDLAINFDLVKCITKINMPKLQWKGAEDFHQNGNQQDVFSWCIQWTLKLLDVM